MGFGSYSRVLLRIGVISKRMFPLYKSECSIFNYDDIPAGYYFDAMLHGSSVQKYWHKMKFQSVIEYVDNDDDVLDFGCGPGSFLHLLGNSSKCFNRAVGVDISSHQIEFAINHVGGEFSNIDFVELSMEDTAMPFDEKSFDFISMIEVAEHIHPYILSNLIRDLKRCLKNDGRLIITTPNYRSLWPLVEVALNRLSKVEYHEQHINKYTPNSFLKFLETMGLEVISYKSIFVLSPFFSALSSQLADRLLNFEKKIFPLFGCLLIAETRIKEFE